MPFDSITLPEVTTTLIAARQYIEENGWCRNFRRGKKACIVGALYTVTLDDYNPKGGKSMPNNPKVTEASKVLTKIISPEYDRYACIGDIIEWNDKDSTSKVKVLELFDRAIARSMQG